MIVSSLIVSRLLRLYM